MSKKQERKKRRARRAEQARVRRERYDAETEPYRERQMVRGARSNRFMLVRYLSAFLFFLDLSWLVIAFSMRPWVDTSWWALALPLLGIVAATAALVECMVRVAHDEERLKFAEPLYKIFVVVCALVALATLVAGKDLFFPFFASPLYGIALCLFQIVVCAVVLVRLKKIREHTDKRYDYLEQVRANASDAS